MAIGGICFFVAISTFNGYAGMSYENTTGLFVTYLLFPLICVVVYVVSQLILVVRTLDDRWVIGDLIFGVGFYTIGVVLLFAFSVRICDAVRKYRPVFLIVISPRLILQNTTSTASSSGHSVLCSPS